MQEPRYKYSPQQLSLLSRQLLRNWYLLHAPSNLISSEVAVRWIQRYALDIIDDAIQITADWAKRKAEQGVILENHAALAYASAVMRNKTWQRDALAESAKQGGQR